MPILRSSDSRDAGWKVDFGPLQAADGCHAGGGANVVCLMRSSCIKEICGRRWPQAPLQRLKRARLLSACSHSGRRGLSRNMRSDMWAGLPTLLYACMCSRGCIRACCCVQHGPKRLFSKEGCTPPVRHRSLLRTRRRAECPSSMAGLRGHVNVVQRWLACGWPVCMRTTFAQVNVAFTLGSHQDLRSQVALNSL